MHLAVQTQRGTWTFVSSSREWTSSFRPELSFFLRNERRFLSGPVLATMLVSRDDRRESFVSPGERESRINVEGELRPWAPEVLPYTSPRLCSFSPPSPVLPQLPNLPNPLSLINNVASHWNFYSNENFLLPNARSTDKFPNFDSFITLFTYFLFFKFIIYTYFAFYSSFQVYYLHLLYILFFFSSLLFTLYYWDEYSVEKVKVN